MKTKEPSGHQDVLNFLDKLDHPLKEGIVELRKIILKSNVKLTEHIKWNAPSFCVDGEDRLTMRLFPPKNIQLIFHRGAKVKVQPKQKLVSGHLSFLKWPANDRAVATFNNLQDVKGSETEIRELVNEWIDATT
jgi:hypothetical protein